MTRTLAKLLGCSVCVLALVFYSSCTPQDAASSGEESDGVRFNPAADDGDDHGHPHPHPGEDDHAEEDHAHPNPGVDDHAEEDHPHPQPGEKDHAEEDHPHPHPGEDEHGEEDHPHPHPGEDDHAHEDHPHPHPGEDDHAHDAEGEHGHAHGEAKTAQITVWTEQFELFVEHQYPVVNTPVRFITHVTNLETLHPRREGPVTFVMRGPSGESQEHSENAPARDGIYLPDLTFPKAGAWGLSLRIPLDGERYWVDLGAIEVYANQHAAMEAPDPESFEGIGFLKEQQWKILSRTEPVRRRPLTERLRLTGVVRAVPGKRALVTPPVEGRLMLAGSGLPFLGDSVVEGQILAVLQPVAASALQTLALELQVKEAEVQGQICEAQAALEKAEQSLKRTRDLHEKKAKSVREVEEAELAQRQAAAGLSAARALMNSYQGAASDLRSGQATPSDNSGLPVLPLKAPIDGGIVSVDVAQGEFVRPEKSLFTILDTSSVLIEARVPESDLQRIRPDLGASYALPGAPDELKPVIDGKGGRFVLLSNEVDTVTRTAPLVYDAPNPDGHLRIGLALTVFVETDHSENALVLPTTAIVEEEGRSVAYVQLSGETFERRDLELGIRSGDLVEVVSGLNESDRVVTKGAYAVRLASVSSVIPAHGHAH